MVPWVQACAAVTCLLLSGFACGCALFVPLQVCPVCTPVSLRIDNPRAGLRYSASAFFCNYFTVLLTMLVAQSWGLLLGTILMDPKT